MLKILGVVNNTERINKIKTSILCDLAKKESDINTDTIEIDEETREEIIISINISPPRLAKTMVSYIEKKKEAVSSSEFLELLEYAKSYEWYRNS